jgi:hypothetical protein
MWLTILWWCRRKRNRWLSTESRPQGWGPIRGTGLEIPLPSIMCCIYVESVWSGIRRQCHCSAVSRPRAYRSALYVPNPNLKRCSRLDLLPRACNRVLTTSRGHVINAPNIPPALHIGTYTPTSEYDREGRITKCTVRRSVGSPTPHSDLHPTPNRIIP